MARYTLIFFKIFSMKFRNDIMYLKSRLVRSMIHGIISHQK